MKRVAVVQSSYIPWKGYFDLINSVDEFILFDDVQYTRRDWRNRNLIKAPRVDGYRRTSIAFTPPHASDRPNRRIAMFFR